jgi:anti-repressor protein
MNKLATINKPKERQTPIEIVLQIDEQGMTTAMALYSFLELDARNYSHWVKRNITGNRFAIENEDYMRLVIQNECLDSGVKGRFSSNYKLTASFAKKLAMGSNSPKGEEARDYFIQVEQNAKKFANSVPAPKDNLEIAAIMIDELRKQRDLASQHELRINQVEQRIDTVKEALAPQGVTWREIIHKSIDKIVEVTGDNHYNIWSESYRELDRHGFNVRRRLENRRKRMAEFGLSKTAIGRVGKLDIIEADSKAKEIYAGIVREMVLRYVV